MLYSLQYFLSVFGLGEMPGVQPGDTDEGAASDLTNGPRAERSSASTSIESTMLQNTIVDMPAELKRAARLHIWAGQLVMDCTFSTATERAF